MSNNEAGPSNPRPGPSGTQQRTSYGDVEVTRKIALFCWPYQNSKSCPYQNCNKIHGTKMDELLLNKYGIYSENVASQFTPTQICHNFFQNGNCEQSHCSLAHVKKDDLFICNVCLELLKEGRIKIYKLCGHVVCTTCFQLLDTERYKCPPCRIQYYTADDVIDGI